VSAAQRTEDLPAIDLEGFQKLDEIRLLSDIQAQTEERIVMIDDGGEITGAAVVKVRWMLPQRTERRRPILFGRASRGVDLLGPHGAGIVKEGDGRVGATKDIREGRRNVATGTSRLRVRCPEEGSSPSGVSS
jgi:hypothetical protein